jgi:hypothetical protein
MLISVKRKLAVVTVDSDIVGMLWKIPHNFINTEYADILYAILARGAKYIEVDGRIF